jgi:hypothetical protein
LLSIGRRGTGKTGGKAATSVEACIATIMDPHNLAGRHLTEKHVLMMIGPHASAGRVLDAISRADGTSAGNSCGMP